MPSESISGSCLCGAIKFETGPPYAAFRYCHCSRCRKASGSAHAANLFVPETQFKWTAGETLLKRFAYPQSERFAVWFCSECGTRMPHKVNTTDNMLIPAGTLDVDPGLKPSNSIFWQSKSSWYVSPHELPAFDEYK